MLFAPVGWWLRRPAWVGAAGVVALGAAAAVPRLVGLVDTPPLELVAVAGGVAAGWMARTLFQRLSTRGTVPIASKQPWIRA